MWGLPSKLSKSILAAASGVAVIVGGWAAGDLLDEVKAATGWTWLGMAAEALKYVRIVGLSLVLIASAIATALLVRQFFHQEREPLRDRLLYVPTAADVADDAEATAGEVAAADWVEGDRSVFHNEALIIPDLVRADDPIIRNKTFINCDIIGPAIIEFTRTHPTASAMTGCLFNDTDAVLYRLGAKSQTGIVFEDCRFVDCRFYKTLLLFPMDAYNGANAGILGLNWITEPPLPGIDGSASPAIGGVLEQALRKMADSEKSGTTE